MISEALARALPGPLITHYGLEGRVELSGATFHNWVSKTANLFEDLGGDPDEPIALGLLESDPGHWITLVWCAAAWLAGAEVVAGVPDGSAFAVVGPQDARRGEITVACSLHPLGRGFAAIPKGCLDYADVLAQPDLALEAHPLDDAPAFAGVSFAALHHTPGRSDRRLFVDPVGSWDFLRDALVAPVLGAGSSVIAVGASGDALARIAATERTA